MLRHLDVPVPRAQSRRELPRPARQPRQLPRQPRPADAAVPARGERGRHRARLREGHRARDGRGAALERRPDARVDGDLQRVVRPRADAAARRDRPGRRGTAPAVDRLDPHRVRPGRAGARLHQVGQPAGVDPGGARGAAARAAARADAAVRADLREPRRRAAGGDARRAAGAAGRRALCAAARPHAGRRDDRRGGGAPARRAHAGDPDGPRRARATPRGRRASRSPRGSARA